MFGGEFEVILGPRDVSEAWFLLKSILSLDFGAKTSDLGAKRQPNTSQKPPKTEPKSKEKRQKNP